MEQTNNLLAFVKLIITSSEKRANELKITEEQKKEYINKRLFEHFEKSGKKMEEMLPIYEEAYPEFSKDDFTQYVIDHTSNIDIIYSEKLKIEKKMNKISARISEIDNQLGTEENLSAIELRFRNFQQHQSPINAKISQIKMKYQLPIDIIRAKNKGELTSEQLQEYIDLISEMVESSASVEELYVMAKEQIQFFSGMGEEYEKELKKRSPELFEYIEKMINSEIGSLIDEKQKLEDEKEELKKLQAGFLQMFRKYDTRLPANLRGTEQERQQREENERRKRHEEERRREARRRKQLEEERRREARTREETTYYESSCGGGGCSSRC